MFDDSLRTQSNKLKRANDRYFTHPPLDGTGESRDSSPRGCARVDAPETFLEGEIRREWLRRLRVDLV
jgi:hypothetical protein